MPNYKQGKIYKIVAIDGSDDEIYIGSTTKKYLSERMTSHRNGYKQWKAGKRGKVTSHDLFDKYGLDECEIILLESVPCNSKDELLAREKYYIKTLSCVNKYIPTRSKNEYYKDNESKIKEYKNEWYGKNKEELLTKSKQRYEQDKEKRSEKMKEYYEAQKKGNIRTS
jgi:hypothetical protein